MTALSLALKFGPWAIIAILSLLLQRSCAQIDHAEMQAKVDVGSAQLDSAKHDLDQAGRTTAAISTYADRTAALQPIIVKSTDTVRTYAETPTGRALCLAPNRVSGLDQLDRDLFLAAAPGERARALPANPGPPAVGRISEQR